MTAVAFEAFLARLYTDARARARFLAARAEEARRAGLTDAEIEAAIAIDVDELELVAISFARRRERGTSG